MIHIESYRCANGVPFGSREDDFVAVFGAPTKRDVNREEELKLHYPCFIVRFGADSQELREVTLLPNCESSIDGLRVEWAPSYLGVIQDIDSDLVEVLGFILSLKLGLAFSGFHDDAASQMAIHAFRKGDWDMFRDRMTPFHFEN